MVWQTLDLQRLIFEEFFKISPSLLAKYHTVQDQLLYLILIPHVVLFMFLLMLGNRIIGGNKILKRLLMITAYIYIIWSGFYGTIFVPIMTVWFMYIVIGTFILFLFISVIPHTHVIESTRLLNKLGEKFGEKLKEPEVIEKLKEDLKEKNRKLRAIGIDIDEKETGNIENKVNEFLDNKAGGDPKGRAELYARILPILAERDALIKELEKRGVKKI